MHERTLLMRYFCIRDQPGTKRSFLFPVFLVSAMISSSWSLARAPKLLTWFGVLVLSQDHPYGHSLKFAIYFS